MTRKSNENLRALLEQRAKENAGKIFLFSEADGHEFTAKCELEKQKIHRSEDAPENLCEFSLRFCGESLFNFLTL
jgi:hypothetical protein